MGTNSASGARAPLTTKCTFISANQELPKTGTWVDKKADAELVHIQLSINFKFIKKNPPTVWALFSVFKKRVNYIPASNIKSCNVQIKISVYFFLRYLLLLSNVSFQENNSSYSMFYSIKHTCMSEGTHIC